MANQRPAFPVPIAEGDTGFHRIADNAVLHEINRDHARGLGKSSIRLCCAATIPMHAKIAALVFPDHRRIRIKRPAGFRDAGQGFVINLNQLGSIHGLITGFGNHECHRVPHIAHAFGLQDMARGGEKRLILAGDFHLHRQRADAISNRVMPGQDRHHTRGGARFADIHGDDARMGMR
jgi:hypothetical protein